MLTNIEPPATINSVTVWPGSGLIFMAADTPKIQVFYVPSLGPAPKWCRFLDNLTEELEEEEHNSVYDDYKFVTREELGALRKVVEGLPDERERAEAVARVKNLEGLFAKRSL